MPDRTEHAQAVLLVKLLREDNGRGEIYLDGDELVVNNSCVVTDEEYELVRTIVPDIEETTPR